MMHTGTMVVCAQPADVPGVWPLVSGFIDSAFAELDEPTPDYLPWLLEGKGLLWVCAHDSKIVAGAISSFVAGRKGKALRVVAVGGRNDGTGVGMWRDCIRTIEYYAKANGCYKVTLDGRRGWLKVLSDYDPKCVSFEKAL